MKKILSFILIISMLMSISAKGESTVRDNEIKNVSVHDPSIIKDNGKYYVFGSHITTAESKDLINWDYTARGYKTHGNVHFGNLSETLAGSFKWAGEDDSDCKGGYAVWAPDVYYNEKYLWEDGSRGAYMMYYSASSTYKRSCIGLAVSKDIDGVYEYVDTVVYSGFTKIDAKDENSTHNKKYTNTHLDELIEKGRISSYKDDWGIDDYNSVKYPNAIDPCVFEDDRGRLYLTYGSWSGGIFVLPINSLTGIPIYPGFDGVTEDGRMIDRYFGTHIAGGKGWSGEGPFVWYDEEAGYYYLQTSYEWLGTDGGYHIRMFRSTTPEGPFVDMLGNSAVYGENHHEHGVKMFGNYYFDALDVPYTSPGHSSALVDDDGNRYVFFHTRFKGSEHFQLRVHQMFLNEDGWLVVAPFRHMGESISEEGYTDSEIVGVYEFINHGNGIGEGTRVNTSKTLMLLADGKIEGAEKGRWTTRGKYVTFYIGDETYKGVFFAQKDEKGQKVMTFSLLGGKNEALWGVRRNNGVYLAPSASKEISFENSLEGMRAVTRTKNHNPVAADETAVTYEDGIVGKAIRLDGNFGLMAEGITPQESMSVSFWMKPEKVSTYCPILASSADFVASDQKWFSLTTFSGGNDALLWSRNAEAEQWLEGKAHVGYQMGKWQHITVVFDKTYYGGDADCIAARLYINGMCVATGSVTRAALGEESRFYFGINPWDDCFEGLIDEVRVFDRVLSHDDVLAHYYSYGV